MIRTETTGDLTRTYSDDGRYVVRDGVAYEEAVDPTALGRTYTEGDPLPQESLESSAMGLLAILTGEEP